MFGTIALGFNNERDKEIVRLYKKNLRDSYNVLDIPDERFSMYFRVSKEIFVMLLKEMEPIMKTTYRCTHIPPIHRIAAFLTFLATGAYQLSVGNEYVCSMSKSEVSKSITECLNIFQNHLCDKWIKFEKSPQEEDAAKQHFYNDAGIPGIVGCVDGTHVRIKSPGDELKHLYYNRKGYYSINVMLVCDHNMVITYVDARHPGSNHDAFVWEQSSADQFYKSNYIRGKRNTWLLGDSGYKLLPYLMTKFRNPTYRYERLYNERHCKIRNIIERCIGVLKNRFRCVIGSRGLHYSPEKATQIINACCALHNICRYYKTDLMPLELINVMDNDDFNEVYEDLPIASGLRDEIARNLILIYCYCYL